MKSILFLKKLKILLTVSLLLSDLAAGSDTGVEVEADVKVFSMNLHCFEERWQQRFDTILTTLIEEDIAVYSFQELCIGEGEDQVAYLLQRLQELHPGEWTHRSLFTHRAWDKYDESLLIVARGQDHSLRSALLPVSPLRRGYVAVQVGDIWFVNTHLEYHEDNAEYRLRQLEYLADEFGGQSHVIMGDFNSSPEMREQEPLRLENYEPHFPGLTYPAALPEIGIDGFWLSPGLKARISTATATRLFGPQLRGGVQSDHLGVMLEFTAIDSPDSGLR
jgi:endonuclease/exonuclease/phosphatase family metal-dependent hydrolase